MASLVRINKLTSLHHSKRQLSVSMCHCRRKKPPARDMSKRNLKGEALAERLRLREEDIERQRVSVLEAYSKPSQSSKMELFAEIVNGFQLLTIFA